MVTFNILPSVSYPLKSWSRVPDYLGKGSLAWGKRASVLQGDGAVPPDVQNLILLMPFETQPGTLPLDDCPSPLMNSFSGVRTPTLLWLRKRKHPIFHLRGQHLPPPGPVGGQGPISTLLNTTAPVWPVFKLHYTSESDMVQEHTPVLWWFGLLYRKQSVFFPLWVCSWILSYSYFKQIHTLIQVGTAVCVPEQTSTGVF